MSSSEIIKCRKCHLEAIFFTDARNGNGVKIPFEVATLKRHDCMFSDSWECGFCGNRLYFDYGIRSTETGRRIPLNYYDSTTHVCPNRKEIQQ
jgi:hypothetical protein